jgi:hypothetical protein
MVKKSVIGNKRVAIVATIVVAVLVFLAGVASLVWAWVWASRCRKCSAKEEVKVVVVAPTESREPPVYPSKAPEYPLRNQPQDFQQVGMLVSQNEADSTGEPTMLALFGRKMQHRDRWEYYAASDKAHLWRLPVQVQKRTCDDELGCDEIYNNDQVVVPDYGDRTFTARIYKYAAPQRVSI